MPTPEIIEFTADANLIQHMITSQSGTLGKALMEAVMNAIDAGSSRVTVTLATDGFQVNDDGRGIGTRDEIIKWFARWGTPHAAGDATYGKYRIGRGQLFSFASTVWRTGTFQMAVDTRGKGQHLELVEFPNAVKGCKIAGTLYSALSTSELDEISREFVDLVRYSQIPVSFNGRVVSKRASDQKWDMETPEAYIRLDKGEDLQVYNLGVLVRSYPAYTFGTGGVIVSKLSLSVNVARNDILTGSCQVWREIRRYMKALSLAKTSAKEVLTKDEREFLAREISYGDVNPAGMGRMRKAKLLTDAAGRHHSIEDLERFDSISVATEEQARLGAKVQRSGNVLVLAAETMDRFRCSDLADLLEGLHRNVGLERANFPATLDFATAATKYTDDMRAIDELELTAEEHSALEALRSVHDVFYKWYSSTEKSFAQRELRAGASDVADGWTDGATYIYIDRKILARAAKRGAEGFFEALMLLVHEYCHDFADLGSHTHDNAFLARHHDAVQYRSGKLVTLSTQCAKAYKRFLLRWEARALLR